MYQHQRLLLSDVESCLFPESLLFLNLYIISFIAPSCSYHSVATVWSAYCFDPSFSVLLVYPVVSYNDTRSANPSPLVTTHASVATCSPSRFAPS
ncbi:hypothetical protein GEMRC1_000904 [Eukaryota sp. GEM-RC1]